MTPSVSGGGWLVCHRLRTAVLETVALFGLIAWVYVAAVAATDLERLDEQFGRWLPLRIDTAGVLCFAASAIAFLLLGIDGDRIGGDNGSEDPG
jgi:hypothetical protein